MKCLVVVTLFVMLAASGFAQKVQVYNPNADAKADIAKAVTKAADNGKHVFLQIGGNWCPWCIKFHNFVNNNAEIKSYIEANYEVVRVNYDAKNKQEELMAELGFPQRFGFPVFVILDENGTRIHTQNSAFLEKDKSYDSKRVLQFYKNWSMSATDPATYKKE
jgi:thioredoxin-related protein